MKTIKFLAIAAAVVTMASCGQSEEKTSKYGKLGVEVSNDPELVALEATQETVDSVSYLLGVNYGLMFKGNGFFETADQVNMEKLQEGIMDAMNAGEPSNPYGVDEEWAKKFDVSPYDMNAVLNGFIANRRAYTALFNKKLGEAFLAQNRANDGVMETESGLQYKVLAEGEGELVSPLDTITIKYAGTLLDGSEFDSNESFELQLTRLDGRNNVIEGWVEGICLLNKGAKATLYIPGDLAYGENGRRGIEPNATLVFDVEVLDVKKYQE